ncbi:MAG: hypothetical protein P8125_07955 [Gemmatimonadota bacterium]
MRVRIPLLAVAATAAFSPLPLPAQEIAPPAPRASRMRATMRVPSGMEYVGRLESWDAGSLMLSGPAAPSGALELSEMAKLEVSRGMKGNAGTGALIGAGVGLLGSIVAGVLIDFEDDTYGVARLSLMVVPLGGMALGAITGALIRTEKWQELPIPGSR